jgi:ketosteroid isomerase-like protein
VSITAAAETDEVEIRNLLLGWAAAVQAEDLDAIVVSHSPDIVMFDVPEPFQTLGIDAYRQSWVNMFSWFRGTGTFEITELVVAAGNQVAFCYGSLRCRGAEDLDEEYLAIRLTVGLQKIGGRWLVVHEHHSEPAADKQ